MAEQDLQRAGLWERIKAVLSAAALLLAIVGAVALLGGFALWLWADDLRTYGTYLMIAGGVILAVAALFGSVNIREALSGQRGRFAINAILMVAAFTGIVVFVNFISFHNVARADLTASKQFSLALQTAQVLENLNQNVHAVAFFVPERQDQAANQQLADDLMFEFERRSSRTFTYEFIDPESDPSRAELYELSQFPSIVFQAEDSGQAVVLNVPPLSEQDLTSMLLIVTGEQQKKVYFVTGHGEKDAINPDPEDGQGFAFAARGVLADSYTVDTLNLAQVGIIPEMRQFWCSLAPLEICQFRSLTATTRGSRTAAGPSSLSTRPCPTAFGRCWNHGASQLGTARLLTPAVRYLVTSGAR